jgi:hypothetical protein
MLMKKVSLISALFLLCSFFCFGQSNNNYQYHLKLSGGRTFFGTGDIVGFAVGTELSKSILKKPKPALNKLLVGAELTFENGVRNPKVKDVSAEEFIFQTFRHTSNTALNPKLTYYPFGKILSGFNIAVGPSIAYSYQSTEWQASRRQLPDGLYYRTSFLEYNNGWLIGYRISTGYEVQISKKILTGVRLDFTNYNNGDINTLAALKLGARL